MIMTSFLSSFEVVELCCPDCLIVSECHGDSKRYATSESSKGFEEESNEFKISLLY